jgi:hypothetical protein
VPSTEETVAVRRGETAEDDGLTTWKRYSFAVPESEMPPSKPPRVMAFSEPAGAAVSGAPKSLMRYLSKIPHQKKIIPIKSMPHV